MILNVIVGRGNSYGISDFGARTSRHHGRYVKLRYRRGTFREHTTEFNSPASKVGLALMQSFTSIFSSVRVPRATATIRWVESLATAFEALLSRSCCPTNLAASSAFPSTRAWYTHSVAPEEESTGLSIRRVQPQSWAGTAKRNRRQP